MTAPGRLACCVPFCRRTTARTGKFEHATEMICGRHWRLARRARRLLYGRLRREIDRDPRAYWEMTSGSPERLRRVKVHRLVDRLWEQLKREAIGCAMGVSA